MGRELWEIHLRRNPDGHSWVLCLKVGPLQYFCCGAGLWWLKVLYIFICITFYIICLNFKLWLLPY